MLRKCQVVVVFFFANGGEVTVEKFLDQTDLSLEKKKRKFLYCVDQLHRAGA